MSNVKDHLKGNVTLQYYRKGELTYKTDHGLMFTVPISDTGDGLFMPVDKAIFFMRWIKPAYLTQLIEKESNEDNTNQGSQST